jgi:hypothetical protein
VKKQVSLLCELKMPIIGIVENMKMDKAGGVQVETEKLRLRYLGAIPFDPQVEEAIGNETRLMSTTLGKVIQEVGKSVILAEKREQ